MTQNAEFFSRRDEQRMDDTRTQLLWHSVGRPMSLVHYQPVCATKRLTIKLPKIVCHISAGDRDAQPAGCIIRDLVIDLDAGARRITSRDWSCHFVTPEQVTGAIREICLRLPTGRILLERVSAWSAVQHQGCLIWDTRGIGIQVPCGTQLAEIIRGQEYIVTEYG